MAVQGDVAGIEEALEFEFEVVVLPHRTPTEFQSFPCQVNDDLV